MIFLINVLHQLYHLQLQVAPESKKRLVMEESNAWLSAYEENQFQRISNGVC